MLKSLSTRNIAHLVFRRKLIFFTALITPPLITAAIVLPKKSQYESQAAVMVKLVDQEMAAPDSLSEHQRQSALTAPSLAKQILSSEILIMTSGEVFRKAIERTGIETVYPGITAKAQQVNVPVLDLAAESLAKDLEIKTSGETNVLAMSAYNTDPQVARSLLNNVIVAAMEKQASVLRDPRTEFLERKLQTLQVEADAAKRALSEFKRARNITAFDEERSLLLKQRDEIQMNLSQTRAEFVEAQGRGVALAASLAKTPDQIALTDENDRAQRILEQAQARLSDARARYENAQRRYTKDNPELVDMALEVENATKAVERANSQSMARVRRGANPLAQQLSGGLSAARSDVSAYRGAVQERERQLEDINKRLAILDTSEIELRELENRQTLTDTAYRAYLERAQSAKIVSDMNEAGISGLSIVEQPSLPYRAARPKKPLLMILAIVGGLVCSFGLCLLLETLDDTFGLPEQVEETVGLPVLASVSLKKFK